MATLRVIEKSSSYHPIPLYRDIRFSNDVSMKLDLNSLCIQRPTETFFILVKNPHLISWGIELDDLLIVERTREYVLNDLCVVEKNGDYKFYQFFNESNGEKLLFALDSADENLRIHHWSEVNIVGVITNVVHQMRHRFLKNQASRLAA